MGVHGLWKLIEPSGRPVPLETLENKVLAVDISIWIHQAIKGFQDSKGGVVPNAHLLGIYHRLCKLLYFKIKPIFVFDGGVPQLKKQTMAKRNQLKSKSASEADELQKQLLITLLKHTALSKVLSEKAKATIAAQAKKLPKTETMYMIPEEAEESSSSEEEAAEPKEETTSHHQWDLHTIDTSSSQFKSLPLEVKHEILTELKETRKQSSWGRLHELPKQSDDFSSYQMNRLLKRKSVQTALDDVSKEMSQSSLSLTEIESLLKNEGIETVLEKNVGGIIASDENKRYIYVTKSRQDELKAQQEQPGTAKSKQEESKIPVDSKPKTRAEQEEEEDLRMAIALSLQEEPSTSSALKDLELTFLEEDSEEELKDVSQDLSSARNYMTEYSGLAPKEISRILQEQKKGNEKRQKLVRSHEESHPIKEMTVVIDEEEKSGKLEEKSEEMVKKKLGRDQGENKNSAIEQNSDGSKISKSSDQSTSEIHQDQQLNKISIITNESQTCPEIPNKTSKDRHQSKKNNHLDEDQSNQSHVEKTTALANKETVNGNEDNDSSSDDFEEVQENDPDDSDLFSDIFQGKEDVEKLDEILKAKLKHNSVQDKTVEMPHQNDEESTINGSKMESEDNSRKDDGETQKSNVLSVDKELNELSTTNVNKDEDQNSAEATEVIIQESAEETNKDIPQSLSQKLAISKNAIPKMNVEEMKQMQDDLHKESVNLMVQKSSKERMGSNITDQMYEEAQELLELFGVPYIVAPMEAEAQCAFLDLIDLTNGTITDDSDIWLFGGQTVYKNFFNQSKYVMEFKSEAIRHHFKLSREQMILLALLVGSDYTIGISGVGPVTALEILAAFPQSGEIVSGLREFKTWFHNDQTAKLSLKKKLKNITFTENFPNVQVVQAYLEPTVETSKEGFTWGKPDVVALTVYAQEKFGWTTNKIQVVLGPVIKRLEGNTSQKSIRDYFQTTFTQKEVLGEGKISKRVMNAVEKLGKDPSEVEEKPSARKKRTRGATNETKRTKKGGTGNSTGDTKTLPTSNIEDKTNTRQRRNVGTTSKTKKTNKEDAENSSEDVEELPTSTKTNTRKRINESSNTKNEKVPKKKKPESLSKKLESLPSTSTADEELKLFEDLASDLKMRRRRKAETVKTKESNAPRKKKEQMKPQHGAEVQLQAIPEELQEDSEVQLLLATTSKSLQKSEEIAKEAQDRLNKGKIVASVNLHSKEVIHQKVMEKSEVLRNKMRAIEVFRKSKKGPGYVKKGKKGKVAAKKDAELSEDSSSDE